MTESIGADTEGETEHGKILVSAGRIHNQTHARTDMHTHTYTDTHAQRERKRRREGEREHMLLYVLARTAIHLQCLHFIA